MKAEAWIFAGCTIFLVLVTPAYWLVTDASAQTDGGDWTGTSALAMTTLLTLMVTSKGIAGVPRASLVVIAATLTQFGLPIEGIALVLGIDQFLDMGRSATNIVGNAVATSVITKWEGMLEKPEPAEMEVVHAPSHTPSRGRAGLDLDVEP